MKNNKGFTFVELIVVLTILAILGIIAYECLRGYTEELKEKQNQNETQVEESIEGIYIIK